MGSRQSDKNNRVIAVNRKARRHFAIQETLVAGLVLKGSEVKSLRSGMITVGDGFVEEVGGELFLSSVHIKEYSFANRHNHAPMRRRKLLLSRREIGQVVSAIQEKGCTCVPLKFFITRGLIKVELGYGKGKKLYDRREDIKARDAKRDMERSLKR